MKKKKRERSLFREYFELIVETAVFVFFVMTFVVQAFQIPTGSMKNTLLIGDFLLVNKFVYSQSIWPWEKVVLPQKEIKRGDIVVFKFPRDLSKDFVKRVIAVEGEKIEIKDKQVYINDKPIEEPYKVHTDSEVYSKGEYYPYQTVLRDNYGPVVVPKGHLFVMGDNRDNSMDSRYWGFLPRSYVKGKPWIIYFSYKAERGAYLKTRITDRLKKLIGFIPKARWRRILKIIK
ncbi:MAG: signal peptidase I [Candidatus Aminicenantia bacterium]